MTNFYTSTWYTIWDLWWTYSVNPYFDLYTQYNPLEKGDDTEVNGIGGLMKTKGIGTAVLDMEDDRGKINILF